MDPSHGSDRDSSEGVSGGELSNESPLDVIDARAWEAFERNLQAREGHFAALGETALNLLRRASDASKSERELYIEELERTTNRLVLDTKQSPHLEQVVLPANLSNARILALSTAQSDGGYLTYAEEHIRNVLGPDVDTITLVPYALADRDAYAEKLAGRFAEMGYKTRSVHQGNPLEEILNAQAIFVGGGNTFRLLVALHETGIFPLIRQRVEEGMPYMGASAGSNITFYSTSSTNDMPIAEQLPVMRGLHFFRGGLNPHYKIKDPNDPHKGESNAKRIHQLQEDQPNLPVIGVPEGDGILCLNGEVSLVGKGTKPSILFRGGGEELEIPKGDLSFLAQRYEH